MRKAVRSETGALIELQYLEKSSGPRGGEEVEIGIRHNHAAEVQRLHSSERSGDFLHPGRGVAAPVLANQVEHGGAWLALDLERLELGEAARELVRGSGVAERHGDVLAGDGVDLVPALAHQRHGVAVTRVGDDALPYGVVQSAVVVAAAAAARDSSLSRGIRHSRRRGC